MSPSVHRLHLATYKLAGEFNPPSYLDSRISIYGYLVITDSGPLLVDTGGRLVLIAAQASFTAEEYLRGGDPDDQAHSGLTTEYVDSIVRLKAMGADETCFSHDARAVTGSGELHD